MIYDFSILRPTPTYPTYPPYHEGKYLEDYFFDFYIRNKEKFDAKGRTLIPISWTTLYVENTPIDIQDYINQLDPNGAYFTVCQHDDTIRQQLPTNTLKFEAGGLGNGIPIPLVCSKINVYKEQTSYRNLFCSFVGSITHPIRQMLYNEYNDIGHGYYFSAQQWSQTVEPQKFKDFVDVTMDSVFALAPRGYGATSFRLYEVMQLGVVPIYVSDKHWLPWQDELNWNEFCVIVKPEQIPSLHSILCGYTFEQIQNMREKAKLIYDEYFSLEGVAKNILKRL